MENLFGCAGSSVARVRLVEDEEQGGEEGVKTTILQGYIDFRRPAYRPGLQELAGGSGMSWKGLPGEGILEGLVVVAGGGGVAKGLADVAVRPLHGGVAVVGGVRDGVGALGLGGAVLRVVEVEAVADVAEEPRRGLGVLLGQTPVEPGGGRRVRESGVEGWGRRYRERSSTQDEKAHFFLSVYLMAFLCPSGQDTEKREDSSEEKRGCAVTHGTPVGESSSSIQPRPNTAHHYTAYSWFVDKRRVNKICLDLKLDS